MGIRSWLGVYRNVGWNEAEDINSYAMFLGYISMAIKGLGFLVLTWTTVVLLGGFVSTLQKKDFWCLTFITLVQMAGIFDVALNEKLRYMVNSARGLMMGTMYGLIGNQDGYLRVILLGVLLGIVLWFVQLAVFAILLCPLAFIYLFGIVMSAGVSLWRLIEHDYMENTEEEASNLVPALNTLYYLALIQGVLFCYKFIMGAIGKVLAKETAGDDCGDQEFELLCDYLHETKNGCEKDPSFAKGRNLITQAVDMIGSDSPADCATGVKMLYTAIHIVETSRARFGKELSNEQQMLMKHLVLSTSSRHVLQKLLETLDSRGTHDRATRNKAAVIVKRIALDINLEKFPGGIEHISSLIGTFQEYIVAEPYLRERFPETREYIWELKARRLEPSQEVHTEHELEKAYKDLLLEGLCILQKLAANRNNCRVISDTQDLVSKIMAPVTSDLLDHTTDDHGPWSDVVEWSMEVMIQLTGARGETGTKLHREISSCAEAMNTLQRILSCTKCYDELKEGAIQILTSLYMGTERSRCGAEFVVISSCIREDFVRMLVDMFTSVDESTSIRICARAALSVLYCHGAIADIQTGGGDVIDSLTIVLLHTKNTTCRQAAAELLEHLCTQYAENDACCGKLQKAMADVMPEVIGEILRCCDQKHNGKEADHDGFAKTETNIEKQCDNRPGKKISSPSSSYPQNDKQEPEKVIGEILRCGDKKYNGKEAGQDGFAETKDDIENKCDNSPGKEISSPSSSHPQNDEQEPEKLIEVVRKSIAVTNLLSSLLSLCATVNNTFATELGPDFAGQFHESSFIEKLREMVVQKSDYPTVENVLLLKAIGKIVISTMKHGGKLFNQEDLKWLIVAISIASKKMLVLDYSMVFSFANSRRTIQFDTVTPSKLNSCTLASVVKEAQALYAKMPSTSVSG